MQRGTGASAFARVRSGHGSFNVPVTFYEGTMRFTSLRMPKVDELAHARDVAGLLEAAGHGDAEIRKAAVSGLAEIGPSDGLPAVIEALGHPSDRVRCAAIRVLCEWGEPMPLAEAVAWLPPAGSSRQLALAAIAQLDEPHSAPTLTRSLVRGNAQEGLWEDEVELVWNLCDSTKLHDALDGVIDLLLEALEDDRDDIAARAQDFLLWLKEEAVPALTALARSSPAPDRAVWALGQIGGASALDPLIEAVEHPDARTREEACVALGELRDPVSVEALLRATRDSEHGVRVNAAAALDHIGTVAFVAGVSAMINPPIEAPKPRPRLPHGAQNGSAGAQNRSAGAQNRSGGQKNRSGGPKNRSGGARNGSAGKARSARSARRSPRGS
jgi:HEAT repeat protein